MDQTPTYNQCHLPFKQYVGEGNLQIPRGSNRLFKGMSLLHLSPCSQMSAQAPAFAALAGPQKL
eukprot:2622584-Amphidinium_carterae.4